MRTIKKNLIVYFFTLLTFLPAPLLAQNPQEDVDIFITRIAIFSNLLTNAGLLLKDSSVYTTNEINFSAPSISSIYGTEIDKTQNDKHRYSNLQDFALATSFDCKNNLLAISSNTSLSCGIEFKLDHWRSPDKDARNTEGFIVSINPLVQLKYSIGKGYLFALSSIGVSSLDKIHLGNRNKGTLFQFSDTVALGFSIYNIDMGVRFNHFSNLDITKENPGLNFYSLFVKLAI